VIYMVHMLTKSGMYTKWGLTTLRDIPSKHPYRKAYRIYPFVQLPVGYPRRHAIALYV
jgi:hypothetical protein